VTKLMIRTWAGPLPEWTPQFLAHVQLFLKHGWKFVLLHYPDQEALDEFSATVQRRLGVKVNPQLGSRKICEFDPALAAIFPGMVAPYDFWGHYNLDCVYGRVWNWLNVGYLQDMDVFGNDPDAICGPFSVYRNTPLVNHLFRETRHWREIFEDDVFHGFDEGAFSQTVRRVSAQGGIRFKSQFWQSNDRMELHVPIPQLHLERHGGLMEIGEAGPAEIMMFHFNETRKWPILES
jgi:hypothetical protein